VKPVSEDSALQDPERLAALRATGLLDAPPEESFDRFTRLARRLLGASFAQLSLVDDHRQFAMSVAGPEGDEVPRDVPNTGAICPRVVATGRSLAAGDLREHPELHDSPAVTDHGVVAYAGVPVRLRRGAVIGSFCVFGEEARVWSDDDMEVLDDLGAAVAAEIDLRAQLDERHRVETELAETRDQLRGILDFSPALIYLKDLEGRYLLVNRSFAEALDRTEEEIVGHLDVDVLDAPSLEVVHAEERQVLATGALVSELRTLDTDEGRQHWRTLKFPLRDEAGEIYALCGIASDETARVRDMDALAESQDRLRRAFDDAPIGMAMLRSGAFVRVNDALCEMLGYSAEELCSMRMADVAHPDDLARDRADVDRMLRGEINTMLADTRLIAADGSEREVLLSATALGTHGGAPDEVSLQMQDVTDRRRARRELTLRHEAARALFDANDIVVAAPDVLAAMAELIGASQATLWLDSGDGTLRRIAAWSRRGIPPEQRSPGDAALRQRTMSEFQVLWRQDSVCVPVQTQRQAPPLGVAEFVRDNGPPREDALEHLLALTGGIALFLERRRHEHELARARDEALDASRMKSSFLANMSHEIRTPMNGVIGRTPLPLGSGLDEEQRRWATTLRTSGRALLTIIDDILDFSKVEAGKLELERVQFSLHEVVDATCDILAEQARNKGLMLEAFVERRVPDQMWGDPGRLQQVLTNIMSNAVKFTDRGSVTLRVNVVDESGDLRFVVADTGIGIAPEAIQRLFEPFLQADTSTTRRYGGTGLGLSISRQLVELMGGSISATSVPDEGTEFVFTVPLGRAGDAPGAERRRDRRETPTAEIPGNGRSVLVVDDNQVNQTVAAEMLRRGGYEVEIAADGREAVAATARRRFDAVLMDCQMPVMDGMEAARQIRSREGDVAHTPIIALTSSSMKGDREDALAAGMDAFLAKPVTVESLTATVARWTRPPAGRPDTDPEPEAETDTEAAPAPQVEKGPVLDQRVLDALGSAGDESLVPELARLFEQEAQGALAGVRAALADEDGEDVARAAHGLKGSASTLGATQVSILASELERAGHDGRLKKAATLLKRLGPAVTAATEALSAAGRSGSGSA
jgi:PAS domain S-box-containing protein